MSKQFSNKINPGSGPPPGAGRTISETGIFLANGSIYEVFPHTARSLKRQIAAERDANTTHRDGNTTGMAFPSRSDSDRPALPGLAAILAGILLLILAATTLGSLHPKVPQPCIKPTAMPATWFGDCGTRRSSP